MEINLDDHPLVRFEAEMRQADHTVESAVEFPHGRAEIHLYEWQRRWNGVHRARPDMYIFELAVSRCGKVPALQSNDIRMPDRFQVGNVALIPPDVEVRRNIASGRRRALLCMFDRAWLDKLLPRMILDGGGRTVDAMSLGKTEWLLRNIYQEMCREHDLGTAIVVESFAKALAIELARRMALSKPKPSVSKGGLAAWRMRLLHKRLLSNVSAPNLTELAELCGVTVRHLCRAFKAETGITPYRYINVARAQHARTLLSQTSLTLNEIARRLGYASSASFSNAFQRATGLKPRQIERPTRAALPA